MKYILYLSLSLLLITVSCTAESPPPRPNSEAKSVQDSKAPKQKVEPTPEKQTLSLTQEEINSLNDDLPENSRKILEVAEEIELMSIGSKPSDQKQNLEDNIMLSGFMRVPVLGKTKISDDEVKSKVINALYGGIAHARTSNACFYPRHAIRAASKGKKVELVICFECLNFRGNAPEGKLYGQITREPEELFNRLLASAGVPLSK